MTQTSETPPDVEQFIDPQYANRTAEITVDALAGLKFHPVSALEVTIHAPYPLNEVPTEPRNRCFGMDYVEYHTSRRMGLFATIRWAGEPDLALDYDTVMQRIRGHMESQLNQAGYTIREGGSKKYRTVNAVRFGLPQLEVLLNVPNHGIENGKAIYKETLSNSIVCRSPKSGHQLATFAVRADLLEDIPGLIGNVLHLSARWDDRRYNFALPNTPRYYTNAVMRVEDTGAAIVSDEFYRVTQVGTAIESGDVMTCTVPLALDVTDPETGKYYCEMARRWINIQIHEEGSSAPMTFVSPARLEELLQYIREHGVASFNPLVPLPVLPVIENLSIEEGPLPVDPCHEGDTILHYVEEEEVELQRQIDASKSAGLEYLANMHRPQKPGFFKRLFKAIFG